MKIITKEEEDEHYKYTVKHGLKGSAIGLGVGLGLSLVGQRFSPFYRHLTLPLKAFFVSSITTASFIITAERASLRFEKIKYGEFHEQNTETKPLSRIEATKKFLNDHRWSIIGGTWVLGMAGSIASLWRNKYLTTSQKLVQARMYSQGLTIIVLLASAALSMNTETRQKEPAGYQQWKQMVIDEERRMNKVSSSQ
ncbi:hypothetical protein G9A89_016137 [Geosiphon pyriformis]|nr:hypothetical protein G9A89_016137 [Geosiphon pyriformis]